MRKDQLIEFLLGTNDNPTQLSITLDNVTRANIGASTFQEKQNAINSVFGRARIETVSDSQGEDYIIQLSDVNGNTTNSVLASELSKTPMGAESFAIFSKIQATLLRQRGAGV